MSVVICYLGVVVLRDAAKIFVKLAIAQNERDKAGRLGLLSTAQVQVWGARYRTGHR